MFGQASFTFEIFKMAAITKWPPFKVRCPDFSRFTDFDENWYLGYFGDGEQDGGVYFSKFQNGGPRWPPNFANFTTFTNFDQNQYSGYFWGGKQDGGVYFSNFKMAAQDGCHILPIY